jgi:hypothetical protein
VTAAGAIAKMLGGGHRSGAWWRCRCPSHASRGATFALRGGERREAEAAERQRGIAEGLRHLGRELSRRRHAAKSRGTLPAGATVARSRRRSGWIASEIAAWILAR